MDMALSDLEADHCLQGPTPSADGVTYSPEASTPSPEGETSSPDGTDVSPTETPISSMYLFFAARGQFQSNVHEPTNNPTRKIETAAWSHEPNNRVMVFLPIMQADTFT
jgi:hypothetical protein